MAKSDFKIYYKDAEKMCIEHTSFPRFKADVNLLDNTTELDNIVFLEQCTEMKLIALAMKEAREFVGRKRRKK